MFERLKPGAPRSFRNGSYIGVEGVRQRAFKKGGEPTVKVRGAARPRSAPTQPTRSRTRAKAYSPTDPRYMAGTDPRTPRVRSNQIVPRVARKLGRKYAPWLFIGPYVPNWAEEYDYRDGDLPPALTPAFGPIGRTAGCTDTCQTSNPHLGACGGAIAGVYNVACDQAWGAYPPSAPASATRYAMWNRHKSWFNNPTYTGVWERRGYLSKPSGTTVPRTIQGYANPSAHGAPSLYPMPHPYAMAQPAANPIGTVAVAAPNPMPAPVARAAVSVANALAQPQSHGGGYSRPNVPTPTANAEPAGWGGYRPRNHHRSRPGRGVKEKKYMAPPLPVPVATAVSMSSEAVDAMNCWFNVLTSKQKQSGGGYSPQRRALAVYRSWQDLTEDQVGRAINCMMANHAQDMAIGWASRQHVKSVRGMWRSHGVNDPFGQRKQNAQGFAFGV